VGKELPMVEMCGVSLEIEYRDVMSIRVGKLICRSVKN